MKRFLQFVLLILCINIYQCSFAWDGYDYENGTYIEIGRGNLVRSGNDIEVYDYGTGEYKDYEVQSVYNNEVEVYDYDTGEYRTFDMDEN